MELLLLRPKSSGGATISALTEDGLTVCFICEDVVREEFVEGKWTWKPYFKIQGKTAIPSGRYKIVMDFSNRFQQIMPHLLDVPDFEGIRMHPGNSPKDTEGCLLPGTEIGDGCVKNSRKAYEDLFTKFTDAHNAEEEIYITIKNDWVPGNAE